MKCFYHNDMDGHCAGYLVRKFTENDNPEDYFESDYSGLDLSTVDIGERVYIVDYSFTEATIHELLWLINYGCDVIWIDHHASSLDLVDKYPELKNLRGIRSSEASGAALTYMWFMKCPFDTIPEYVKLVSDYDTWAHKMTDSDAFKLGIDSYKNDVFDDVWTRLDSTSEIFDGRHFLQSVVAAGYIIKSYIDRDNESYLDSYGFESELDGVTVYAVNKSSNSWIFGDLINSYPAVVVFVFNGSKWKYSIFSSDNGADCQKIAENHGGGGHKHAAGFTSDELLLRRG